MVSVLDQSCTTTLSSQKFSALGAHSIIDCFEAAGDEDVMLCSDAAEHTEDISWAGVVAMEKR